MSGHWHNKYIGLDYIKGSFDCSHLCELVYQQELGINLILPQHSEYHNLPDNSPDISKYQSKTDFVKVEEPQEYDIVLMRRGELHFGVYFTLGTTSLVLNNLFKCGVIAEKIRTLKVLGYYRWNVAIQPIR